MKTINEPDVSLTYIDNSLRKVVNGLTLVVEYGTNLRISFLCHEIKEIKTFQLDLGETELLIQYLKAYHKASAGYRFSEE